ncbi:restriction endonuclease subunit S, partial [Olsenella uli]
CVDPELPFDLPDGWEWARLGSIVLSVADGDHQPPPQVSSGIPFLVISNVSSGYLNFEDTRFVPESYYESLGEYRRPMRGDVLYTVTGSYGIVIRVLDDRRFCVQRHIGIIRPNKLLGNHYLSYCLQSGWIRSCADSVATGIAQKTVGLQSIRSFLVPVPPLAEQRRIVVALDELLGLVDEVERSQAELEGLLDRARAKVLDLAIRGRLVPQDPSDEPAEALLARVREERLLMAADGRLRRRDVEGDSVIFRGEDNSYYERFGDNRVIPIEGEVFAIPRTWAWSRFGAISNYGSSESVNPEKIDDEAWVLDLEDIEKGSGRILRRVCGGERRSSSVKRPFCAGQLLYSKLRPYLNKVLIAPEPGYCTSEIIPIELYGTVAPSYIRLVLMSDYFLSYANRCSYGVKMPRLGTRDGQGALLPIPPSHEQERIASAAETIATLLTAVLTM